MFLIKHKSGKFSKLDFANMVKKKKGTIADLGDKQKWWKICGLQGRCECNGLRKRMTRF